jgi:hypothetical protein
MAKKTWKLGEVAIGGVIVTETNGTKLTVIVKQQIYSSKSQANAKELERREFDAELGDTWRNLTNWLAIDITTSYWADQIAEWFENQGITFKKGWW